METRDTALEQRLSHALDGLRLGKPCYAFQELTSTMDVAHQFASQDASEGTCVWAEKQTAGRGRAGRVWSSAPGGIYLSVILRPSRQVSELPQLSLVAGLAVAEAIQELTSLPAVIRWPNDVLFNGKKLAGILTEASTQHIPASLSHLPGRAAHSTQQYAVAGIGINVTTDPQDLPDEATTLQEVSDTFSRTKSVRHFERLELAPALFRHLEWVYQQWDREGFPAIRPAFLARLSLLGSLVHIRTPQEIFEGQAMDVDEEGRLLVRLESGVVRTFEVGEVTLLR